MSNHETVDLARHSEEITRRYPPSRSRSALIPLLHLAQRRDGYLTRSGIDEVAGILGLSPAEVTAVATFYTMLHMKPKGRHVVSVCHNIACTLSGAEEIISNLESKLGISCGETTSDGEFTLERAECLAACDLAPMMQIDYDQMIGPLTATQATELLERLEAGGERPVSREAAAAGLARASEGEDLKATDSRAIRDSRAEELSPSSERAPDAAARAEAGQGASAFDEPLLIESISISDEEEGLLRRKREER